jgi:RNA polymerase sigma-70 factor (ECF subfamily)
MVNECISFYSVDKKLKYSEEENYFEESFNNIESQFSIADIQYLIDSYRMATKWCSIYMLSKYKHQEIASM